MHAQWAVIHGPGVLLEVDALGARGATATRLARPPGAHLGKPVTPAAGGHRGLEALRAGLRPVLLYLGESRRRLGRDKADNLHRSARQRAQHPASDRLGLGRGHSQRDRSGNHHDQTEYNRYEDQNPIRSHRQQPHQRDDDRVADESAEPRGKLPARARRMGRGEDHRGEKSDREGNEPPGQPELAQMYQKAHGPNPEEDDDRPTCQPEGTHHRVGDDRAWAAEPIRRRLAGGAEPARIVDMVTGQAKGQEQRERAPAKPDQLVQPAAHRLGHLAVDQRR